MVGSVKVVAIISIGMMDLSYVLCKYSTEGIELSLTFILIPYLILPILYLPGQMNI